MTPKLTVAVPPGETSTACVHGAVVSQVPTGEISWTSPRSDDASWLATRTVSSPREPGASRNSGVSTARSASAASAWTSDCSREKSSSGGRLASGPPGSPIVTSAASSSCWPSSSRILAATKYRPSAAPGAARTVTSHAANPLSANR